ncbi:MAG: ABC transporter permease [Deltaproteobacteria bacterium]|nr:ABC transporter permease [Deltaproteobacteria bacterium]MBT4644280.1 ABC transporter permease [Deltaproteobacteria bacterium]MBT6500348.1 ABC transporter permease [Deltaproteobacteria bacterium]MBT6612110.1 ABC transporter permease [Deltaproteobacteria bacterium]MBT7151129.1 ABC transporter permease [Deltaproteobacteria bacterium]
MAPGDAVTAMIGDMGGATPEMIVKLRAEYGLDQNLISQLFRYVSKMVRGDLGMSFTHNLPVMDLVLDHLPATILLVATAFLLAVFIGTVLGIIAAQKPKSLFNHFVTILSLSGYAAPVFWTGLMMLIAFSYYFPIFPAFGMRSAGFQGTTIEGVIDVANHLILPAVTLASIYIAVYSRLARASMMDVLGSDYIRTARSKGLSQRVVIYKHALKNALLPVVTMAGLQFSQLIAGAVVVETVFGWPGIGQLAFNSILRRDHPLLLGILFLSTLMVVVANLITDFAYRLLDPRIK